MANHGKQVFFILFFTFFIYTCRDTNLSIASAQETPKAVKGVLDLQKWNFTTDGEVSLDGEWEFFPNEFLDPSVITAAGLQNDRRRGDATSPSESNGIKYIPVPGKWNDFQTNEKPFGGDGYATYRLKILLPDFPAPHSTFQMPHYSLAMPSVGTAYAMYINGKLVAERGKVGKTKDESEPFMQALTVELPVERGVTSPRLQRNILIHVSNFHHNISGLFKPIKIGNLESITKTAKQKFVLDLIVFSSLFIMGLYHLGLFFSRQKDKSPLYFGIFCILISLRTISINERIILDAFSFLPFWLVNDIEYFSFYYGALVFAQFMQSLFPEEFSKKWSRAFSIVLIPCSIAVIFLPMKYYTQLLILIQITVLISILYVLKVLISAALNKKLGANLFLSGFLIFAGTAFHDILIGMGILFTSDLASYGLLTFVIFQSIILSRQFSQGFDTAEKLSIDLSQKSDRLEETATELKELTQNLELKVSERTKVLEETQKEIQDLNDFTQKVNSLSNLDSIFTEISKYVYENHGITATWLFLPDEKREFLSSYKFYSYEKLLDDKYNYALNKKAPMKEIEGGMIYKTFQRKKPFYLGKIPKFEFEIDKEFVETLSIRSFLHVPLVRKDESVGILSFSNLDKEMKLSKKDIHKITNLCSQTAGVIDTNHLLEQVDKAKRQTVELNQLIKVLNEKSNLEEIMEMISFYFKGKYRFPYYTLTVIDSKTNSLKHSSSYLPEELTETEIQFMKNITLPLDFSNTQSLHIQALKDEKPLFISDAESSNKSEGGKHLLSILKHKSYVILPLILQKQPIAILDLISQDTVYLSEEDLIELSILTEQLAGIINGSLLLKEVQEEKEKAIVAQAETESLNELMKNVNSVSSLTDIMTYIMFHLEEQHQFRDFGLLLKDDAEQNLKVQFFVSPEKKEDGIEFFKNWSVELLN